MNADERAALVERLADHEQVSWKDEADAADLIEADGKELAQAHVRWLEQNKRSLADGKRLALAENAIADAATALDVRGIPFGADMLAVWDRHIAEAKATLRDYDAAKEALS